MNQAQEPVRVKRVLKTLMRDERSCLMLLCGCCCPLLANGFLEKAGRVEKVKVR